MERGIQIMQFCKEMLGIPVHLAVHNEYKCCPCCGQEIQPSNNELWTYYLGTFSSIEVEHEYIKYYASYKDESNNIKKVIINRRWIGDVIEWKKILWDEDPSEFDEKFNKHCSEISIFQLSHSTIEDSCAGAFATKDACEDWLKTYATE